MAITFDCWTSRFIQNFMGVTGHYWTTSNQLDCVLIDLINVSNFSHTADALAETLKRNVINRYKNKRFHCAVTDSASNMIATTNKLYICRVPCVAHKLQTVITRSLLILVSADKEKAMKENDDDAEVEVWVYILSLYEITHIKSSCVIFQSYHLFIDNGKSTRMVKFKLQLQIWTKKKKLLYRWRVW